VEYADRRTFAFGGQLGLFLEGFGAGRPLIHFVYVLHLVLLFQEGGSRTSDHLAVLAHAFRKAGRSYRHAGALSARLCARVPAAEDPPDLEELCRCLASPPLLTGLWGHLALRRHPPSGEMPPLGSEAFEARLREALNDFRADELEYWLRHGRGPVGEPGKQIARPAPAPRPRSLASILATLLQRPRLAGAVPFVAQLVSALTLPPRRLVQHELPVGGYADVATRGQPQQILPGQFALEEVEFLRRFAENELLYFRREEPHHQSREEVVLLLDQGVRTWGDVRLVLTAAAVALGKEAARRGVPFSLAGTSNGGKPLDPRKGDDQALGALLDASDLSPNPGMALESVLENQSVVPQDLVLLTHPRNLAEPDVTAAARRLPAAARLFAVAVDGSGQVQFTEMRRGVPIMLSRFRVDLTRHAAAIQPWPAKDPTLAAPWTGDVEPVGFPFPRGIRGNRLIFAFDHAGEWLLAADLSGILHAVRTDGSREETLPRALADADFLREPSSILGVRGGFVVAGWARNGPVAAHYDLARRTVKRYCVHSSLGAAQWYYLPEYHSLVARGRMMKNSVFVNACHGVDLATGEQFEPDGSVNQHSRVARACVAIRPLGLPPPDLPVVSDTNEVPADMPHVFVDRTSGAVSVRGLVPPWETFTPLSDGSPRFRGRKLLYTQCRGRVLAIHESARTPGQPNLSLYQGPGGTPLGEYETDNFFALSQSGDLVALVTDELVSVHRLGGGDGAELGLRQRSSAETPEVSLADTLLTVRFRNSQHMILWHGGILCHLLAHDHLWDLKGLRRATKDDLPDFLRYDPERFHVAARNRLIAVPDSFGQVALFDLQGRVLCQLLVSDRDFAAWMPDGTRYGPTSLSGGSATPGALERIGKVLLEATRRAEMTPPPGKDLSTRNRRLSRQ
jgi:hypothetical protein